MLKRWIYIFTLCCFVNSAVGCVPGAYCSDTSLLYLLIGQFQGDGDDGDDVVNKEVCGHQYLAVRLVANARRLARAGTSILRVFRPAQRVYANYLIRKPILPAYYNFLFRLSPF